METRENKKEYSSNNSSYIKDGKSRREPFWKHQKAVMFVASVLLSLFITWRSMTELSAKCDSSL